MLRGRRWVGPAAVAACAAVVAALTLGGGAVPDFTRVSEGQAAAAALQPTDGSEAATATPLVMVTGDSVAFTMAYGRHEALPGVRLEGRSIIGCGIMPPDAAYITGARPGATPYSEVCRSQEKADASGLKAHPELVVLVSGAWEVYDQEYRGRRLRVGSDNLRRVLLAQLDRRVVASRRAGAKVLLVLAPCFGSEPGSIGDERSDPARRQWFNGVLREVAATEPGVELIDPSSVLCHPDGSVVTGIKGLTGGVPRPDGAHYDAPGRAWIWRHFLRPAVKQALDER